MPHRLKFVYVIEKQGSKLADRKIFIQGINAIYLRYDRRGRLKFYYFFFIYLYINKMPMEILSINIPNHWTYTHTVLCIIIIMEWKLNHCVKFSCFFFIKTLSLYVRKQTFGQADNLLCLKSGHYMLECIKGALCL